LKKGEVRPVRFMGEDLVLFRTQQGQAVVMGAYCPHLGAHLGHGGSVAGETIRCPFHGFRFDADGHCISIPYGSKIPPKANAQVKPSREKHGIILVFHHPDGEAPGWEIPELPVEGWTPFLTDAWTIRGHPQETTENSVDAGHFTEIHGYSAVEELAELETKGPLLTISYAMTRPDGMFGRPVRAEFEIFAYGLGYSLVQLVVAQYGVRARLFVLATPIEERKINLRVALNLHEATERHKISRALALLPRALVNRIIARSTFNGLVNDVQQDFLIWQHKRYVQPPILAAGDGPVGRYRLWAKQFYLETDQARI
jgi:nitrite reductase/ring-hydroxylating ferredoxin subunit